MLGPKTLVLAALCALAYSEAVGPSDPVAACVWRPDRCLSCPSWGSIAAALPQGLYLPCVVVTNDTCVVILEEFVRARYLGPTRIQCLGGPEPLDSTNGTQSLLLATEIFLVGTLGGGIGGVMITVCITIQIISCLRRRKPPAAPVPAVPSRVQFSNPLASKLFWY